MDAGCTLDFGKIIDLSCGLLHPQCTVCGSWASCIWCLVCLYTLDVPVNIWSSAKCHLLLVVFMVSEEIETENW